MPVFLTVLGIIAMLTGSAAIAYGFVLVGFSLADTLIVSGSVAVMGGALALAAAAMLRALVRVEELLVQSAYGPATIGMTQTSYMPPEIVPANLPEAPVEPAPVASPSVGVSSVAVAATAVVGGGLAMAAATRSGDDTLVAAEPETPAVPAYVPEPVPEAPKPQVLDLDALAAALVAPAATSSTIEPAEPELPFEPEISPEPVPAPEAKPVAEPAPAAFANDMSIEDRLAAILDMPIPEAGAPSAVEEKTESKPPVEPVIETHEAPATSAVDEAFEALDEPPTVIKTGTIDDMVYSLYSDGSIEAVFPDGIKRFASVKELREHVGL